MIIGQTDDALDDESDIDDNNEFDIIQDDENCEIDEFFVDSDSEDDDQDNLTPATNKGAIPPLVRSVLLFLMLWQIMFNVSDTCMQFFQLLLQ